MALSNVFREPRRELTESAVGILVFFGGIALDYGFAVWFQGFSKDWGQGLCPIPIGMVFGLIFFVLLLGLATLTHGLGEVTCDWLAEHGVHLRPRVRY